MSIEDLIPGSRCTRTLSFVLFQHSCSLLTRYKFRIKAENAYGISDESQESDPFDVNQPIAGESQEPPGVTTSNAHGDSRWFSLSSMIIFMRSTDRPLRETRSWTSLYDFTAPS